MDENKKIEIWNMEQPADGIKNISPGDVDDPRRQAAHGFKVMADGIAKAEYEDAKYEEETRDMAKASSMATGVQGLAMHTMNASGIDRGILAAVLYIGARVARMWFMPFSGRVQSSKHRVLYRTLSTILAIINTIVVLCAIYAVAKALVG